LVALPALHRPDVVAAHLGTLHATLVHRRTAGAGPVVHQRAGGRRHLGRGEPAVLAEQPELRVLVEVPAARELAARGAVVVPGGRVSRTAVGPTGVAAVRRQHGVLEPGLVAGVVDGAAALPGGVPVHRDV